VATGTDADQAGETDILAVFSALSRYCHSRPEDATGLHLFGLVCESLGLEDRAIEMIDKAIAILESRYEESEDAETELQYTIAHANKGRLCLGMERFEEAVESFDTSMGLLPEDKAEPHIVALGILARVGKSIAHFRQGDFGVSLESMNAAFNDVDDLRLKNQVLVLLTQLMLADTSDESVDSVKSLLLER
jgi:superkiller protein 3